jgi:photosynthetic reaction center H subunit
MEEQLDRSPEPVIALRPTSDLAGLPVDDVDGRPAGQVHATIAEADSGVMRYFDVAAQPGERHVLVPVGHARIEELAGRKRLRLRAATREDLARIPAFEGSAQAADGPYQRRLLAAHGRLYYGERYYAHPAYDHGGLYAGEHHPIVRGPHAPSQPLPLAALGDMTEYVVAREQPDIRGWKLLGRDGEGAGEVGELLVDPRAAKVCYVVVERPDAEPALLPVGFVEVAAGNGEPHVFSPSLDAADIAALPAYREPITRHAEDRLREWLDERLDGGRRFDGPDFSGVAAGASPAGGSPDRQGR